MDYEQLFAERIGGAQFGKSTEIYKFEKIKRRLRSAKRLRWKSINLITAAMQTTAFLNSKRLPQRT